MFVSVRTVFGYRSVCVCPLWLGFMRLLCSRFYASFVLLVFMRLLCLGLCIDVFGTYGVMFRLGLLEEWLTSFSTVVAVQFVEKGN